MNYGSGICCECNNYYERHKGPVGYFCSRSCMKKCFEYSVFRNMKSRCLTVTNKDYKYYGGRGITIVDSWKNDFRKFLQDIGPAPSKKHSIDRINNNGPYSAENCRWVTMEHQSKNKRCTYKITIGKLNFECLVDAAKYFNISAETARSRLKRGIPAEEVFK